MIPRDGITLAGAIRRAAGWGSLSTLCLLSLTACAKTLNHTDIAQAIQQDVTKQGGSSLNSVTCPKGIAPKTGESFECIGETEFGYTFTIPVKQQDDQGGVTWEIPHAKGLLNMVKFESLLQETVSGEVGSRPVIRCSETLYKAVKPGQTFDCKLEVKDAKPTTATKPGDQPNRPPTKPAKPRQPDKITVTVDSDGNVSWQRIVPGATKPGTVAKASGQAGQPAATPSAQAGTPSPANPAPANSPAPPQASAEDFLNQEGAAAGFED
jgi:hypothetical protein